MTQKHDPFIFSLELLLDAVAALPSFIIKKKIVKKNWFHRDFLTYNSWIMRDLKAHLSNIRDTFMIPLIGKPLQQSTRYSSAITNSFDGMTLHK